MPYFYFRHESDDGKEMFFAEMPVRKSQDNDVLPMISSRTAPSKGEDSYLANYENLPHHLKSCLDYIASLAFIATLTYLTENKLVRLLVAEGLIPAETGEILEVVAENIIGELIGLEMLQECPYWHVLEVVEPYKKLCLVEVDEQEFISKVGNLPVRAVIKIHRKNNALDFKNFEIRSLFLQAEHPYGGLSLANTQSICQLQFLLVLEIVGAIESLPDEVGLNLVQLTYLGLSYSCFVKLPRTLGNLQKLQTLDIFPYEDPFQLPIEVLKIQQLKHLLLWSSTSMDNEVRFPKEIGMLVNLQTCGNVYAGDGIANELATLTQLRKLTVHRVSEDHAVDLASAIMKMENLVSLTLRER
ncbi:hypothetical protein RCOM_0745080 [Ricinus communis]|uniref:Disease resistance R13L4/SHOC-2-like LRR domain-containing protein n=1 Tax=Ricinus communis TaxID=3988 RepID=B9SGF8_RICCO|nr:hypothetical protein RCOM_0745080 [Ricinus communis]|eukprot:XP_015578384.2 probable disease resistance protein RF45 [Ricinus communis]